VPTTIIQSLRTAKADVMVGLDAGQAAMVIKKEHAVNGDWGGQLGVIQFANYR